MKTVFVFGASLDHLYIALRGELDAARSRTSITKQGIATMKTITTANTQAKSSTHLLSRTALATCAAIAIAGLAGLFSASEAQAFSCGSDFFGAGCAGPRGAVG